MLSAELANVYFATSEGVYRAKFDAVSGRLDSIQIAANVGPVSFLAFNASGSVLYVATRDDEVPAVQAYKVGDDGVLEFLNEQPTGDGTATHLSVHPSGDFLMSAQYNV